MELLGRGQSSSNATTGMSAGLLPATPTFGRKLAFWRLHFNQMVESWGCFEAHYLLTWPGNWLLKLEE